MTPADLIKRHEGYRAFVYDDATGLTLKPGRQLIGNPSIGWGRNLLAKGLSTAESNFLLGNDETAGRHDLAVIFGAAFTEAAEERQAALLDLWYNLGPAGFREFKRMIAAVKAGDWETAAAEAVDSKVAPIRARDDAALMRTLALP